MNNKVLYLSPTYKGSVHDKNICDEEQIRFDVSVVLWQDSGFIGLNPAKVQVKRPMKKPKGKEFLREQKIFNKQVSIKRVKVEHAIGQCKVFQIVKVEVRTFKNDFRDTCMLLACALNNFKMDCFKS